MSAEPEGIELLRAVAARGGSLRLLYNADLDSISAASIILSAARRVGVRAVARPQSLVLDLSRAKEETFDGDALVAVGLLAKGEPVLGRDFVLVEPGRYPQREGITKWGGSASLAAHEAFGGGSPLQMIRAIVGLYATRCYLIGDQCGEAASKLVSAGEGVLEYTSETMMSALRRYLPLDASINYTLYPNLRSLLGGQEAITDGLRRRGLCAEGCPRLEEIEGKRDAMSALKSYASEVMPKDVAERMFSRRVSTRLESGALSDLSDLSLLEEMVAAFEGPQRSLVDSLSAYPGALGGVGHLVEAFKAVSRLGSRAKGSSQGSRSILVEDLQGPALAEVFLKSSALILLEGDQLLVAKVKSLTGGSYLVAARNRSALEGLLAEVEGLGAHAVASGAVLRLWVPPEDERRFLSLIT